MRLISVVSAVYLILWQIPASFAGNPALTCSVQGTSPILDPSCVVYHNPLSLRNLESPVTSDECFGNKELNFGVLILNPYFQISRSTGLGKKGLETLKSHLIKNKLPLPSKIIYLNKDGYQTTLKSWIKALFGPKSAKNHSGNFAAEERDLSTESDDFENGFFPFTFIHPQKYNVYIEGHGVFSHKGRIKGAKIPYQDETLSEELGGRTALFEVLRHILTHNGMINFHCKGGIHRTGMTALMIRYLQGGVWTRPFPEPMILKATQRIGLITKKISVSLRNPAELEYYRHNSKNFRSENLEAIRDFSEELKFKCLASQFSPLLNTPSLPDAPSCTRKEIQTLATPNPTLPNPADVTESFKSNLWNSCNRFDPEMTIGSQMDLTESLIAKHNELSQNLLWNSKKIIELEQEIEKNRLHLQAKIHQLDLDLAGKTELDEMRSSLKARMNSLFPSQK